MNKKLLLSSLFVLTLILLMPNISAIQHKTIEDGIKQDLKKKIDSINLDIIKDNALLNETKYPLLKKLVIVIEYLYFIRIFLNLPFLWITEILVFLFHYKTGVNAAIFLYLISSYNIYRLIFSWGAWLFFWDEISDYYGWNWDLL